MGDSAAFESACELLKQHTTFSEIEARGTVRLALKAVGQKCQDRDDDCGAKRP